MTVVGLVPAAGLGTRLAGTISGSKEVQLVRGRPVMTYLLDRMRRGGATRVIVTTRPEKRDVIAVAGDAGAEVVLGEPVDLGASLRLAAQDLDDEDIALVGFPDSVWTPFDGFRRLVEGVVAGEPIVLGIFDSPTPSTGEVAVLDAAGRLADLEIKSPTPSASAIWAIAAARVAILREVLADGVVGEALVRRTAGHPIAVERLGRVLDIGTPATLRAADTDPVGDPST